MKLALIPQPKTISMSRGWFSIPSEGVIGITDHSLYAITRKMEQLLFKGYAINISHAGLKDTVSVCLAKGLKPEGYRLSIDKQGIRIEGASAGAVFYGLQTLRQIVEQSAAGRLPALTIDDWPDFPDRGVCLDISKGRVPRLERLMELADNLAKYKINQLQLYTKHTFAFRGHPAIGQGASPLTADDILKLDAYCRERHVELIPYFPSFGHLETVLMHPQYHHLAEDWGKCKYVTPDPEIRQRLEAWRKNHKIVSFGLSPANPETYRFLDSLFSELLPLFSSKRFNAGCDETYDLGYGQSYKLCQKIGRGRLYLNHIIKLNELIRKYGKQMMIWGDIIRDHPELIPEIPKDITVLDWGYSHNWHFDNIRVFKEAGLSFYACPSTCSWALFPLLPQAEANIAGFAAADLKQGGRGLLNTDWGEDGHVSFMEYSWHGFVFGAEQAWNTLADRASFTRRFCRLFLNTADPRLARALAELGEINFQQMAPSQRNLWLTIYFAAKPIFPLGTRGMLGSVKGVINTQAIALDAKFARNALHRLDKIRAVFASHGGRRGEDQVRALPYWLFAVDTIRHAARKLAIMGNTDANTPAARRSLVTELKALRTRFNHLWLARNRTSEIRIALKAYQKAIQAIRDNSLAIRPQPGRGYSTCVWLSRARPGAGKLQGVKYPADRKSLCFKKREFGASGYGESMFYDLHYDMFNCAPQDVLAFFACPFYCPKPMKLDVCLGYDGPLKVWIDGKQVYHDPEGTNPANPDKAIIPLDAAAGKHEALIAMGSNHGKAWGLFFRMRPRAGRLSVRFPQDGRFKQI